MRQMKVRVARLLADELVVAYIGRTIPGSVPGSVLTDC
jgi:hypothetical protein